MNGDLPKGRPEGKRTWLSVSFFQILAVLVSPFLLVSWLDGLGTLGKQCEKSGMKLKKSNN